ncbi:MAG: hypothetical protein IJ229_09350 [Clostridia bacterium]|nr:hypothetical protein [Clostridia bacterium]MBR1684038.1 hypothetical protein [Clostridia bacterium]MBR2288061.1 hypothetical protein [Clostridia bacterium]
MYSEAYEEARKEFINCLCMGIVGLGVPFVLAFKEWLPIMRAEKRKALEQEKTANA